MNRRSSAATPGCCHGCVGHAGGRIAMVIPRQPRLISQMRRRLRRERPRSTGGNFLCFTLSSVNACDSPVRGLCSPFVTFTINKAKHGPEHMNRAHFALAISHLFKDARIHSWWHSLKRPARLNHEQIEGGYLHCNLLSHLLQHLLATHFTDQCGPQASWCEMVLKAQI